MATPLDSGTVELVGDSIKPEVDATKVPHAGAVASTDAGTAGAPPPEAAGAPGALPITPDAGSVQAVPMDDIQILPSYADGSSVATPINTSPVDIVDRLKLSMGNKVGQLKYLKSKFEDATLDKSGSFLVKKEGSWYKADPDGFGDGDAWTRTKEIIKDLADNGDVATVMAGQILGSNAGQAIGTAVGGPVGGGVGGVAGAAVGSGAGEALRTSLGRMAGTYEASATEQLKDVGWETLLGAGGQVVGLGVKPTYGMLKAAASKVADTMGTASKDILSTLMAVSLKEPKWAMRRALDSPGTLDRAKDAVKSLKPGMDPAEALDFIQGKQNDTLRTFARDASNGLQSEYRTNLNELLRATPDTFSADVGRISAEAQTKLAEAGYGKIVAGPGGKTQFQLLTEDEVAKMLGTPADQLPKVIGPNTQKALEEVSSILNKYAKFGTLKGKQGAQKTIELKRAIRESFDDIIGPDTPPSIKQVVLGVKNSLDEGVGQTFADAGVADPFIKMNNAFAEKRDAVTMLTSAVNSKNPQEIDNLVKRLASKSGQYKSLKDEAKALANVAGPQGQNMMQDILDWEASKSFLSFAPKSLEGSSAGLIGRTMGLATQQSNPRVVAQEIRAVRYGSKGLDFLKSLGPKQLDSFLSSDKAVGTWASTMMQGAAKEDEDANALLQQAGAIPGGANSSGGQ